MRTYKVLTKSSFTYDSMTLVPLRFQDRYQIMEWRNEQIYHLRQEKMLTPQDQDDYFTHVVSRLFENDMPDQLLFSMLIDEKCIGYGGLVHIDWLKKNAEVSMIMNTSLEEKNFIEIWMKFLRVLNEIANDSGIKEIYTYAYDIRPKLYVALENCGFEFFNRIPSAIRINEKLTDIVQHKLQIDE